MHKSTNEYSRCANNIETRNKWTLSSCPKSLSDVSLGKRHCLFEGTVGLFESTVRRCSRLPVLDCRVDVLDFLLQILSLPEQCLPEFLLQMLSLLKRFQLAQLGIKLDSTLEIILD